MTLAAIALCSVVQTGAATENPRFLMHASYPAGSHAVDPTAAGGNGTSDNFPKPIDRREFKGKPLTALLRETKPGVFLFLGNDGGTDAWLNAADGNLLGWLEAKDAKGAWKPIEYHWWYTCGNSYHRVALPTGMQWSFFRPLERGSFKTQIRWRMDRGESKLISDETTYYMNPDRFNLSPELAKTSFLEMQWITPTLRPQSGR